MNEKKKDLIPVAAIALFLVIIIILCAVRLTERKKEQIGQTQAPAESVVISAESEESSEEPDEAAESVPETADKDSDSKKNQATGQKKTEGKGSDQMAAGQEQSASVKDSEGKKTDSKVSQNKPLPAGWVIPEGSVSSNDPYPGMEGVKKTNQEMLEEMAGYWENQRMDAVEDLAGLSWFRKMSDSIKDSGTFYYYGERNSAGQPHGIGIAVYADHEYYYGSWSNGERSGQGEWFKRYVYYDNDAVSDRAYRIHMYMGEWANDLPNGFGQEHVDLNMSQASGKGRYIQNVIGTFQDGLYSGEMYLTTLDVNHLQEEWNGWADGGIWSAMGAATARQEIPVCQNTKNEDDYMWMAVRNNKDRGIDELLD